MRIIFFVELSEVSGARLTSQMMSADRGTGIKQLPTSRAIPHQKRMVGTFRPYASSGINCLIAPGIEASRLAVVMLRSVILLRSRVEGGN